MNLIKETRCPNQSHIEKLDLLLGARRRLQTIHCNITLRNLHIMEI